MPGKRIVQQCETARASLADESRAELEALARRQSAVAELGQRALAESDLARLMDQAAHLTARILEVEYVKVLEHLPDDSALLLRAGVGWKEGLVGVATVGTGADSQAGYTLRTGAPVVVEDLPTETRFHGPALLREHGVVSGMSVIIQGTARSYGVLGAHTARRRRFTPAEIDFLQSVANVLGLAIERSRAHAALQESQERYSRLVETSPDAIVVTDLQTRIQILNPAALAMHGVESADEILGRSALDFIAPDDQPRAMENARKTLEAGSIRDEEYTLLRKGGDRFPVEMSASLIRDREGNPQAFIGVVRDISNRKRAESRLAADYAVTHILAESSPPPALVVAAPRLLQAIGEGCEWPVGELWTVDETASLLRWAASWHAPSAALAEFERASREMLFFRGRGLQGRAWASGEPIWVPDISRSTEMLRRAPATKAGLRAACAVPIGSGADFVGAMVFFDLAPRPQDEAVLRTMVEISRKIGQSVQRRRAETAWRRLLREVGTAQDEERARVARELHDQMGQLIAALSLGFSAVRETVPDTSPAQPRLDELQQLAGRMAAEVRHLIQDLRAPDQDDRDLPTTLAEFTARWSERFGLPVELYTTDLDAERLPSPIERALYRIVQEALTNAARHAGARRVGVILERRAGHVLLIVDDDGCGFDVEAALRDPSPERRLGLLGMQERAAQLGGTVTIESTPGQGTTVFARIPLLEAATYGEAAGVSGG